LYFDLYHKGDYIVVNTAGHMLSSGGTSESKLNTNAIPIVSSQLEKSLEETTPLLAHIANYKSVIIVLAVFVLLCGVLVCFLIIKIIALNEKNVN